VCRESDERIGADDRTRRIDRLVVLAHVHAVGLARGREVRAVVDQEERPALVAQALQLAAGTDDLVVGRVLHPQLHDVDAAVERGGHDGRVVGHEVEPGGGEPRPPLSGARHGLDRDRRRGAVAALATCRAEAARRAAACRWRR
jgi:hypothetical protein